MKEKYELLDESTMDIEDLESERALQLATISAIHRARQFGTAFVVCEDGQTKDIPADKTKPYEDRLLANAERLNQRIQLLKQSGATDYSLNDKPSK
ncbi:MAG: hypothetical protein EXS35_15430 [Pedosphaera sp.]|nr:hypothetical protein [Pedosphaera sp.]